MKDSNILKSVKDFFAAGRKREKMIILAAVMIIAAVFLSLSVFTAAKGSDGSFGNFKRQTGFTGDFSDIAEDAWYASDVREACSYGLINGVTDSLFAPDDKLSVAECIVIAAKLHSIYYSGEAFSKDGTPWYSEYVQYALENGIITEKPRNYDADITRAQFAGILAHSLPVEALEEINTVEDNSIPDMPSDGKYGDEIYKLYRAGVIVGCDDVCRAMPDTALPRCEAAVILLRMADVSKRQRVRLTNKITIYNSEGSARVIDAPDYGKYESQGWDVYTVKVYAPDGRSNVIPRNNKIAWLNVGWYEYPITTVYAPDGRSRIIPLSEKDDWLNVGWYDYPVMTVYALDGRSSVIPESEKEAWLNVGWYDCPVTTVYAPDGRSSVIPESEKEAWLNVGWYGSRFIPMPQVLSSKNRTTTDIPVLSIGTGGRSISAANDYVPCIVNAFNVEEDFALFNAEGGIRLRGNASRSAVPPPYRIKFRSKQNLFGLNGGAKAKSWVLLNYPDGAAECVKNDIAFRIGRMLLEPDGIYCSDARFVHVYLNESFLGVYLLCEQTQANKHRVNVNEPEDGYTGTDVGYLVEIDNYSEPPYFRMNYDGVAVSDITGKSRSLRSAAYAIKSDTFSKEQEEFIAKYIRGVFHIVYEACEKNNYLAFDENYDFIPSECTDAEQTIDAVADIRSLVDMYILYEIMHDNDVGEGSFFMCVDFSADSKHPKLTFTAPWDFNWTCGGNAAGSFYASTFCTDSFMRTFGDRSNPWFIVLYKQWWFRELVSKRWTQIGGSGGIIDCIDSEIAELDRYQPDINRSKSSAVSGGKYYLNWIRNRAEWLDSAWLKNEE